MGPGGQLVFHMDCGDSPFCFVCLSVHAMLRNQAHALACWVSTAPLSSTPFPLLSLVVGIARGPSCAAGHRTGAV